MTKILKDEKLFSNIRVVYIIVVIMYSLARQNITAIQPYLMSDIFNLLVIGVAGALVCWDALIFKNIWKTKYIYILIVFAGLTVISSVVGFKYGYIENIKALANVFIQFFLLFVVSVRKNSDELKKEVSIIANIIGAFWAIPVIISLYMYFADISYIAERHLWGEDIYIVQGFVREHFGAVVMRLWGVFVDPNFASAISIAILILCIFTILNTKKKWVRVLNIINIILQGLYIILSNSRMALVISCISIFIGVWYFSFFLFKNKKYPTVFKEVFSVLIAVVCLAVGFVSIQAVKNTLPYVRYGIQYIEDEISSEKVDESTDSSTETTTQPATTQPATTQPATTQATTTQAITTQPATTQATTTQPATTQAITTQPISTAPVQVPSTTVLGVIEAPAEDTTRVNTVEKLDREDAAVKTDVSNGRFDLWMEGINAVFKPNPIFGVGPRNYAAVANEVNPDLKISTGFSIHNSFVELLMGNGIVGTLILLVFFVLCAIRALISRYKLADNAKLVGILMVCVLALFACGVFIACLFYTLSGATIILFTILGYAVRLTIVDEK